MDIIYHVGSTETNQPPTQPDAYRVFWEGKIQIGASLQIWEL